MDKKHKFTTTLDTETMELLHKHGGDRGKANLIKQALHLWEGMCIYCDSDEIKRELAKRIMKGSSK